jgi:hypothetical protein
MSGICHARRAWPCATRQLWGGAMRCQVFCAGSRYSLQENK